MLKCGNCINFNEKIEPSKCKSNHYSNGFNDPIFGCPDFQPKSNPKIRQFDSGATRDTDENKPSYVKALSPIVLQGYVEYLGRHRLQSDGNLRDWDNWKKGIPQEVYLLSLIL